MECVEDDLFCWVFVSHLRASLRSNVHHFRIGTVILGSVEEAFHFCVFGSSRVFRNFSKYVAPPI
jgi:hypothetical protein